MAKYKENSLWEGYGDGWESGDRVKIIKVASPMVEFFVIKDVDGCLTGDCLIYHLDSFFNSFKLHRGLTSHKISRFYA